MPSSSVFIGQPSILSPSLSLPRSYQVLHLFTFFSPLPLSLSLPPHPTLPLSSLHLPPSPACVFGPSSPPPLSGPTMPNFSLTRSCSSNTAQRLSGLSSAIFLTHSSSVCLWSSAVLSTQRARLLPSSTSALRRYCMVTEDNCHGSDECSPHSLPSSLFPPSSL